MIVVRRNLRIKMINSYEPSSHIVKSLADAFSTIGKKYCPMYLNVTLRVVIINHE